MSSNSTVRAMHIRTLAIATLSLLLTAAAPAMRRARLAAAVDVDPQSL